MACFGDLQYVWRKAEALAQSGEKTNEELQAWMRKEFRAYCAEIITDRFYQILEEKNTVARMKRFLQLKQED